MRKRDRERLRRKILYDALLLLHKKMRYIGEP